jgi:hypothetical protein
MLLDLYPCPLTQIMRPQGYSWTFPDKMEELIFRATRTEIWPSPFTEVCIGRYYRLNSNDAVGDGRNIAAPSPQVNAAGPPIDIKDDLPPSLRKDTHTQTYIQDMVFAEFSQ